VNDWLECKYLQLASFPSARGNLNSKSDEGIFSEFSQLPVS